MSPAIAKNESQKSEVALPLKLTAAATSQDALLGRLRINSKMRCAPPPRPERPGPGRPQKHGTILHPGWDTPEVPPDEEIVAMHINGELRLRRWQQLHFEDCADTILDVVRI